MKQYLNTLYITTPESYLFKDGECVAIKQEGQVKGKIPVHTLGSLVLFGQVSCSPFLLGHCAENGVTVSWLTETGRFLAAMNGPVSGTCSMPHALSLVRLRNTMSHPVSRRWVAFGFCASISAVLALRGPHGKSWVGSTRW